MSGTRVSGTPWSVLCATPVRVPSSGRQDLWNDGLRPCAALKACTFRLWRTVRDRLDAAVGRESPLLAARLGADEGRMYRELRTFVRGIEQEISDRGAVKLLAEAGKAGVEDEEVRP